jgi:uncharacterized protein (DUF58 family)
VNPGPAASGSFVTTRAIAPFLALAVGAALTARTGSAWLWLVTAAAFGFAVAGLVMRPQLPRFSTRPVEVRATVGQPTRVECDLTNEGTTRTAPVRMVLRDAGFEDLRVWVAPLDPGETARIDALCTPIRRAYSENSTFVVTVLNPLGASGRAVAMTLPARRVIVHPDMVPVRLPAAGGGSVDDTPGSVSPMGVDIHGIREWRQGDAAREVHWRNTARRGRPVVIERELPSAPRVAVLVVGPASAADWEDCVTLAASAVVEAARQGRQVALAACQDGLPLLATGSRTALLDRAAALVDPRPPGARALARMAEWLGPGGELLVAAPAAPPWLWWAGASNEASALGLRLGVLRFEPQEAVR